MTLNEAIQTFKNLGLIEEYSTIRVNVKSNNTNVPRFLFECRMPVSEAKYFFGNLVFITSWLITSCEDNECAELVLSVVKEG